MNWYDHEVAPDEEEEIRTQPTLYEYIVGVFLFVGFIAAIIIFIGLTFKSALKLGGF